MTMTEQDPIERTYTIVGEFLELQEQLMKDVSADLRSGHYYVNPHSKELDEALESFAETHLDAILWHDQDVPLEDLVTEYQSWLRWEILNKRLGTKALDLYAKQKDA